MAFKHTFVETDLFEPCFDRCRHQIQTPKQRLGVVKALNALGDIVACADKFRVLKNSTPQTRLITFGKHKGTPIRDLPADYVDWLTSEKSNCPPQVKRYIRNEFNASR